MPLAPDRFWRALAWMAGSLVAITAVKMLAFDYIGVSTPFLLYFVAIIAAAWTGGWAGGLIATALSGMLGSYFFLPPLGTLRIADFATATRLGVFLAEGVAITLIVTRMRRAQEGARTAALAAQSATSRLEGVLRGVSDGITVQTAKGQLIYANAAAAAMTGFPSADALLAAPVSEIIARFEILTPDGAPYPVAELPGRLALAGLPAPERLVRFRVRGSGQHPGSDRWALVRATAVDIAGSDAPCAVNVFQDVTETRRRDEELRISREWFSTTLRSIGDAVIATDAAGRVVFMNPVAEQLTGWDSDAAAQRPLADVFRVINEQTRAPVESPVEKVLREGKVVGLANHTLLISRDGRESAIDDSVAPIPSSDGKPAGAVLVFRDVSQKRLEEQRRLFISRASAELASSLDYRETLGAVARAAVPTIADWCAVDVFEEGKLHRVAVSHEIERRYPPDPSGAGGVYQVARSGKHIFMAEIPDEMLAAAPKDADQLALIGQLRLRSYIAVPLAIRGETLGVISLAMAESGRVYSDDDLEVAKTLADRAALAVTNARLFGEATEARKNAERASRAKDEFLAMLGHELRNPLAPMLTALQLMKLRAPDALERERSVLERQVKHVVTLVDDLLDVSRITRHGIQLAKEPVDLADTLAKALELAGPLIEERRHTVEDALPRGLFVAGDPVRLAQVFANLLTNAAKYTEPGGRIEVSGEREGNEIIVRVRDNGVGIHSDLLPQVFELFVQGDQPIDRARGGLGLGLAIVRSVVELHDGRVSAASGGPGQGSEFRVVLPALSGLSLVAATPDKAPAPARNHPTVDVLVVDDNGDALELMAEVLGMVGYRAHVALDAAEAITIAEAVKPAAALLDIGLPVMDGYELARRLRAIPGLANIKLVAVTGYGQAADKERALAAGFDEHVVKPISVEQVQKVLEKLLGSA